MIVFAPIAIVVVFFLIWRYSKPSMKGCLWRMDHSRDREGQVFYRCMACGAETLVEPGKKPDYCATISDGAH